MMNRYKDRLRCKKVDRWIKIKYKEKEKERKREIERNRERIILRFGAQHFTFGLIKTFKPGCQQPLFEV